MLLYYYKKLNNELFNGSFDISPLWFNQMEQVVQHFEQETERQILEGKFSGDALNKARKNFLRGCYYGSQSAEHVNLMLSSTKPGTYFAIRNASQTSPPKAAFIIHIKREDQYDKICIYDYGNSYYERNLTSHIKYFSPEIAKNIPQHTLIFEKHDAVNQIIKTFMGFGLKPFIIGVQNLKYTFSDDLLEVTHEPAQLKPNAVGYCDTKYGRVYKFPEWFKNFCVPEFWLFPETDLLEDEVSRFLEMFGFEKIDLKNCQVKFTRIA